MPKRKDLVARLDAIRIELERGTNDSKATVQARQDFLDEVESLIEDERLYLDLDESDDYIEDEV